MSSIVKLSSRTPFGETVNGLDDMCGELLANPSSVQVAVIWFDVQKITESFDKDRGRYKIPTVEVQKIEPLGVASQIPAEVVEAVLEAARDRLGQDALPFDSIDPDGVEVYASGPDNDDARDRITGDDR